MILRAPEYSDLDLLFALENDPQQWITSNTRAPFSRAALKQFIVRSAQYDIFACVNSALSSNWGMKEKRRQSVLSI